jgi:hypothetical protein
MTAEKSAWKVGFGPDDVIGVTGGCGDLLAVCDTEDAADEVATYLLPHVSNLREQAEAGPEDSLGVHEIRVRLADDYELPGTIGDDFVRFASDVRREIIRSGQYYTEKAHAGENPIAIILDEMSKLGAALAQQAHDSANLVKLQSLSADVGKMAYLLHGMCSAALSVDDDCSE